MRYLVHIEFIGSAAVEVDADDKFEAMDKALAEAPQNDFGGAGWDPGDWYVPEDDRFDPVEEIVHAEVEDE